MGRPKTMHRHLPVRMRFSHGAWYHVTKGQWKRLGDTYATAILKYAEIEASRTNRRDVSALLTAFMAHPGRSAATAKGYRAFAQKPRAVFGHLLPVEITVERARRYLDEHPKASMARHEIALLSAALSWGAERGWLPSNPLLGWRKGKVNRRKRYISEPEFAAILTHARPDVAEAIRFLYLTGLRVRDALALRWSDVKADGLHVRVHKTKDALILSGARLDTQLRALRGGSVVSLHILTGSGRPLTYTILRRHFKAAASKAGCPDVTIHDIRRKRITDLTNEKGREFARKLAAHTDAKTTDSYYADKVRVEI